MSKLFDKLVSDHNRSNNATVKPVIALNPNFADTLQVVEVKEKEERQKDNTLESPEGKRRERQMTAGVVPLECRAEDDVKVDLIATETKDPSHTSSWTKILNSTTECLHFVRIDNCAVKAKNRSCNCYVFRDFSVSQSDVAQLEPRTRVNRFSEMNAIAGNKCSLFRQLNRLRRVFPSSYDFFPPSWNFPSEMKSFQNAVEKHKFYILKPGQGSQGKGIKIAKSSAVLSRYESMGSSRSPKASHEGQSCPVCHPMIDMPCSNSLTSFSCFLSAQGKFEPHRCQEGLCSWDLAELVPGSRKHHPQVCVQVSAGACTYAVVIACDRRSSTLS
eukprot:722090-Hanusia_phi.AAC.2